MSLSHYCAGDRVSVGEDDVVIIRLAGNDLGTDVESRSRCVEIRDPVLLNQVLRSQRCKKMHWRTGRL